MTVPGEVKGIEEGEGEEMEKSWGNAEKKEEEVGSLRGEMSGKDEKEEKVFTGSKLPPAC